MNRARFKPAVDGACAHVEQRCRFIGRNQAAWLGASVASLLWRDERPVDYYRPALFHRDLNALECSFHARLLIVFLLPDARSRHYNHRAQCLVKPEAASRLAVNVNEVPG